MNVYGPCFNVFNKVKVKMLNMREIEDFDKI